MGEWQDIASARYGEIVLIRAGRMSFEAVLVPDVSINESGDFCDQWQAAHEGEHPPCWTDGACWESNEDDRASLQPTAWMPLCQSTGEAP